SLDVDFDVLLAPGRLSLDDYDLAGELTSYMLAAYGPAKLLALGARADYFSSLADVRAAFDAVYGESPEAMRDEFYASGWSFGSGKLGIATCGALPAFAWQNGISESRTLGCEHGSFRNVFDVPETGQYRIVYASSSNQSGVDLRMCPFGFGAEAPYA